MSFLGECMAVAATAHAMDEDKGGNPYFLHCIEVMQNLKNMGVTDELHLALAICHDLGEDHPEVVPILMLLADKYGYAPEFRSGLDLVTRKSDETYREFIRRIADSGRLNIIRLKKADLMHNTCVTRLKGIRPEDHSRMKKYHKSWFELTEAESKLNG